MDRTLLGIACAFGTALLLVGLSFSRSVDATADVSLVNVSDPKTLDPQLMTGHPEGQIAIGLFEGLTRYDGPTLRPAPGVAESWEVSPDGTRYVFHLRKDAVWTDGHPVTAGDFVYSWKRLLEAKTGAEYAYFLFPVKYAEAFSTFDGFADTLSKAVPEALDGLIARSPSGLDAAAWQKFVAKERLADPLRTETDPRVAELLSRSSGKVGKDELAALRAASLRAADRLRREAADARAHLGVDGGLFAPDPRTLVVELGAPTPYFLDVTSFHAAMPVPRWLVEDPARRDDWFLPEHIVSNGPFRLAKWLVNDRIRLERSDSYWGKREVRAKAIELLTIESETTAMNVYLTGGVDWLPDWYPKDLVDELRKRPDFYSNSGLGVYYYRLNTKRPPFDDARVRRAVNLAIDRKVIVEDVLGVGQIPAATFVPTGIRGYEPPPKSVERDVPRARELLAEAGYPGGRGFPKIGVLYNTSQTHKKVAEVIADQLEKALGIEVVPYNQEWQSYLESSRAIDYDMSRAAWIGDYGDPNTFLDMFVTGGGNNQTGWSSAAYDRLIRAASDVASFAAAPEAVLAGAKWRPELEAVLARLKAGGSPEARLAAQAEARMLLFREAEQILVVDECPVLPVYYYVWSGFISPEVRGVYQYLEMPDGTKVSNVQDLHPLRDVWRDTGGGG